MSYPIEPIESLLPHKGQMIFLDELVSITEDQVHARVAADRLAIFQQQGELPSYLGLECMVQAAAAMVGWRRRQAGLEPLVGLIIGARDCRFEAPSLPRTGVFEVYGQMVMMEGSLGVFNARLCQGEQVLVHGQVKAIQPETDAELRELIKGTA